ncbi:Lsr2 family protein [Amycolatopsis cynarae]|uniref:Lsr2 family protein n=1 Tax=Amycolatopsis cynarae TaxID=2995223 RepID=A0ABY7B8E9_9PSEU|nr:histone-like nucleoid-structuring protein Lsr2 [Amycolatopsis sp. HUAS 11-8]WAL67141.1 Lsr2 family protein [Amycolatopsis sp. HUAS 11-8]
MPLRAASSIMAFTGPDGCSHVREVTSAPAAAEPEPKDVREWAGAAGMEVPARGKIPAEVVEAYKQAHPAEDGEVTYGAFVIACERCEASLAGVPGWGPADKPAPLTGDEQADLEAKQKSANMNLLEGLASLPAIAEILQNLVQASQKQS